MSRSTSALNSDILGFESPSSWSSSSGTLSPNDAHVEGLHSLAVLNNGWTDVTSAPLTSLGTVGTTLSYQIQLPQTVSWGETRAIIVLPSHGLWWNELGSVPLTGLTAGTFHRVQFTIPSQVATALNSTYSDLVIHVVINAPSFTGQPYLLDQLDLGQTGSGGTGGTGGASSGGSSSGGASTGGASTGGSSTGGAATGGATATGGSAGAGQTFTVTLRLPPMVRLADVALLASENVNLGDRAHVNGAVGTLPATVAMGGSGTVLGADLVVGDVYSRNTVELRDRARVEGSVFTSAPIVGLDKGTIVGSTVTDFAFDPAQQASWSIDEPDTSHGDIMLDTDRAISIAPGRYGVVSIHSRSSVTLSSGDYFFDALDVLEPQAQVIVDDAAGPVRLYLVDRFVYRGDIVAAEGTDPPDLLVTMLGTQTVYLETPFRSFLVAPNATVEARSTTPAHSGAIFAKSVIFDAGAIIEQRGLDFTTFFPTELTFDAATPHDPLVATSSASDDQWQPVQDAEHGDESCEQPGLKLVSTLNGIQSTTSIEYRNVPANCAYQECNADGTVLGQPTVQKLNEQPPADQVCEGSAETFPCGIDESTIEWDDQFGLCETHADCLLFGKVCAQVCRKTGCTGSKDCIDATCQEVVEKRCAKPTDACDALPTVGPCEEREECPDDLAKGNADPNNPGPTDYPASNINRKQPQTPSPPQPPPQTVPPYENDGCAEELPGVTADVVPTPAEEDRNLTSGNDRWGLNANPVVSFNAHADSSPLGGEPAGLSVNGQATLLIQALLWGHNQTLFDAGAFADFGTCHATLDAHLDLVDLPIDGNPGHTQPPTPPNTQRTCDLALRDRNNAYGTLPKSLEDARNAKIFTECLGEAVNNTNRDVWTSACHSTVSAFETTGVPDGFVKPTDQDCATDSGRQAAIKKWIDLYRANLHDFAEKQGAINLLKAAVADDVQGGENPWVFLDQSHDFGTGDMKFLPITYPVGPVTVSFDLELNGHWGIKGDLEYGYTLNPGLGVHAEAFLKPRFSVSVAAFAGVGLGPVVVGISGDLIIVDVQFPMHAGASIQQVVQVEDPITRPRPSGSPYVFSSDSDELANVVGFNPFDPANYDWKTNWTYGAGMKADLLAGKINLEARVDLYFYTKKFKRKIAEFDPVATIVKSFVGTLSTDTDGTKKVDEKSGKPGFGKNFETYYFEDPDWIEQHALSSGPDSDPNRCTAPDVGPCVILH